MASVAPATELLSSSFQYLETRQQYPENQQDSVSLLEECELRF